MVPIFHVWCLVHVRWPRTHRHQLCTMWKLMKTSRMRNVAYDYETRRVLSPIDDFFCALRSVKYWLSPSVSLMPPSDDRGGTHKKHTNAYSIVSLRPFALASISVNPFAITSETSHAKDKKEIICKHNECRNVKEVLGTGRGRGDTCELWQSDTNFACASNYQQRASNRVCVYAVPIWSYYCYLLRTVMAKERSLVP